MASLSGSAAADTAALAALLIPMMRDAGYNVPRSAGLIAAGGIIAPVIPPSIGFIIFGVVGDVSITKLFLAGIFPGILMGVSLLIAWYLVSRHENVEGDRQPPHAARACSATADGIWALLMPLGDHRRAQVRHLHADRGGGRAPWRTRSSSACSSTASSSSSMLYGLMLPAAKTTAVVMFLVAAALVSAWLMTSANIPGETAKLLAPVHGQQDRC